MIHNQYNLRKQDEEISHDKEVIYKGGELFGIPVSMKDMFLVKDVDSTWGLASR
jgi:Asp-tRNA(Asn)/Glu-tRNA(Gln) amidotransferase A subunit family amidase